jgi:hypothetical protein
MIPLMLAGLVGYALISGGLCLLVFGGLPSADDLAFPRYLVALPVLWIGSIASNYCTFAVTWMADRRLSGEDPSVSEALSVATSKIGKILSWTLVVIFVGLVLHVIAERFRLAGVIAARLFGLAWALTTTFVVPILVLDDVTVRQALKRSVSTFKAKWGETVVARGTVGAALILAIIPIGLVVAMVAALSVAAAVVVAVVLCGALMLASSVLSAVVNVALYRYAVDGAVLGAFTEDDLAGSFAPRDS